MEIKNITPLPAKFILQAYGKEYDVSNSLEDWKEIEITLERIETSGVYTAASFPFKFKLDAYRVVEELFAVYSFNTKAKILLYLRRNDWTYPEQPDYIFNLDFSQYEQTDTTIEIPYRRVDLYEYLKTKEGVKFDIPVAEIKEELPWEFDRIALENNARFSVYSTTKALMEIDKNYYTIGISPSSEEEIINKGQVSLSTVPDFIPLTGDHFFLYAYKKIQLKVKIEIKGIIDVFAYKYPISIVFEARNNMDKNTFWDATQFNSNGTGNSFEIRMNMKKTYVVDLEAEDRVFISMLHETDDTLHTVIRDLSGKIDISFNGRESSINIDTVDPKKLLNQTVQKIYDGVGDDGAFTTDIENFNTSDSDLDMIIASESIRGIENAQIHLSYGDFKDWMYSFGYEPFVDTNSLVFRKRTEVFRRNTLALPEAYLKEDECADLQVSVDDDCIYSAVKAGYEKQSYDEKINSRYEFNSQHDYITDVTAVSNTLEIISPFRADCYGIEFLAQTRGKDTTSEKEDKDIFIACLKKQPDKYVTSRDAYVSGEVPNNTLFNGKYNPMALLMMNSELIGISARNIKFSASTGNANVLVSGKAINSNITVSKSDALFEPVVFNIASRNIQKFPLGDSINGVVRFIYRDNMYEGFIKEISQHPSWNMETEWKLWKTAVYPKFTFRNEASPDPLTFDRNEHSETFWLMLITSIKYTDEQPYEVISDSEWFTINRVTYANRIDISISQNDTGQERMASIKFIQHESRKEVEQVIVQSG